MALGNIGPIPVGGSIIPSTGPLGQAGDIIYDIGITIEAITGPEDPLGWFIAAIGQLLELLSDIIYPLISLFSGRPKEEATIQVATRLMRAQNPAGSIYGVVLMRLLTDYDIVISTSGGSGRVLLDQAFGQAVGSMELQGLAKHQAEALMVNQLSTAAQAGAPLPTILHNPAPQAYHLYGSQKFLDAYNHFYQRLQAQMFQGDIGRRALKLTLRHVDVHQIMTIRTARPDQIPPPPPPPTNPPPTVPPGPQNSCPAGYTYDPQRETCVLNPVLPPIFPPGGQQGPPPSDPNGDELTDCCAQSAYYLGQIAQAIQGMAPQGTSTDTSSCCDTLATAINGIGAAIQALPDALSGLAATPTPAVDLTPVTAALEAITSAIAGFSPSPPPDLAPINDALNNLATAASKLTPTDVSGIVEKLQALYEEGDVDQPVIDSLAQRGLISAEMGQTLQGAKWSNVVSGVLGEAAGAIEKALLGPFAPGGAGGGIPSIFKLGPAPPGITGWPKSLMEVLEPLFWRILDAITVYAGAVEANAKQFLTVHGPGLKTFMQNAIGDLETLPVAGARGVFDIVFRWLRAEGEITPDNVEDIWFRFYSVAWGVGQGVHLLKEFAALLKYPASSIWDENSKLLVDLLKFEPMTKAMHGAFFPTVIGAPARYKFQSEFRPYYPDNGRALELFARRLIDAGERDKWLSYNGMHASVVGPLTAAAHRPVSPFILAAGFQDADLPEAQLRATFQYMGLRDEDIDLVMQAVKVRSLSNVRQSYISEALTAYGQGVISDDELNSVFDDAGWGAEARALALKRALIARRAELAKEVTTQVTGLVAGGLMTPDDGRMQLQAAGLQQWQIDLKIELATTRATLAQARRDAAAERKLELEQQRNLTRAAAAEYKRGVVDEAGLAAALAALGLDATLIASIVAVESATRNGSLKLAFGQLLTPPEATLLRDKVAAIEEQRKKQLIDDAQSRALLASLNIGDNEIGALLSRWAAGAGKATTTGERLPI